MSFQSFPLAIGIISTSRSGWRSLHSQWKRKVFIWCSIAYIIIRCSLKHENIQILSEHTNQRFTCFSTLTMRRWSSIWRWSTSLILKVVTDSDRTNTAYTRGWTTYRKARFLRSYRNHTAYIGIIICSTAPSPAPASELSSPGSCISRPSPVNIW